jgi:hypothetical protein
MTKSIVLLAGFVLSLAAVNEAAAQSSADTRPRFFNPFLVTFNRLGISPFGLPQLGDGQVGSSVVTTTSGDTVPVAVKSSKDEETAQPVVVRPPYRPPVRSPYRPPPRGPF